MKNQDFRNLIHIRIIDEVKKCIDYIDKKIKTYGLQGHDFYVLVLCQDLVQVKMRFSSS